ncbi:MAG TPA: CYTH and CHAD domain-containing protein, partial [Ilumatobacteraceae bacterium]|nr:CYTH and CHAD domain-containing protein [Ilumatobacteraceae bacterium]
DLRLLRNKIALRRRTGGEDAGWHLKMQKTLGQRIEIREPLGDEDAGVPEPLRKLLTAHVRDRELGRVARLQTKRRVHRLLAPNGAPVAEVADDDVRAETLDATTQWRELEAELVGEGDDALLAAVGQRLLDAGARPAEAPSKIARALAGRLPPPEAAPAVDSSSTAGEAIAAYLREQGDARIGLDASVRMDVQDAVHKMRVAARRLRSALATYRRLLDRDVTEPLRGELKWLGGVLGPVRDAEVIRDHLRTELDEQADELVVGPVRQRLDGTLGGEHGTAHEQALVELSSPRYLALLDSLERVTDAIGGGRAGKKAPKVLAKEVGRAHRRMNRILDQALASPGPEDHLLHEVRKAAKRARYAGESAAPVLGAEATALAERMEEGQEVLGAHQDSVVVRDLLRRLGADADAAGEPSFTYGRLHALEERRGDEATAQFLEMADDGWADPPSWLR